MLKFAQDGYRNDRLLMVVQCLSCMMVSASDPTFLGDACASNAVPYFAWMAYRRGGGDGACGSLHEIFHS